MSTNKLSSLKGVLGCLAIPAVAGFILLAAQGQKDNTTPSEVITLILIILVGIIIVGLWYNKHYANELEIIKTRRQQMSQLTKESNQGVRKLAGRRDAEEAYSSVKNDFETKSKALKDEWAQTGPLKISKIWKWLFSAGFIVICLGGCFNVGLTMDLEDDKGQISALADKRSWNADNITLPHLEDHSQYVSNPDSILSQEVVDSINETLGRLDDRLGIESAVIMVGHVDNEDTYRMALDVGNRYGVGRNDRGLVIVVAYLDHAYTIAPGRSLEADLTDVECHHLAQDYLIPSMKAEKPDSGMLYLARGVYALMSEKEMPQMSALASSNDDDSEGSGLIGISLLLVAWAIFSSFMGRKVSTSIGMDSFMSNPFSVSTSGGGSSRSWGGGRSSGGGWSSGGGGGYGGGSFGGGGSSGRW